MAPKSALRTRREARETPERHGASARAPVPSSLVRGASVPPDVSADQRSAWVRRPPLNIAPDGVHYLSLIVAFPSLLFITRGQWFSFDEWEFLTDRGFAGQKAVLGLFAPHLQHWSTIPILIYRAIFSVVGLHSYVPYMSVLILAHIVVAHLLWRILRRLGVDGWVATAAAASFLVLGGGWEDLTWAFQIGFIGSVAFGLGAVLMTDSSRTIQWRRLGLIWLLLTCALMCSGVGLTTIVFAAVTALFRRGLRTAVVIASAPTLVYAIWLVLVGRRGTPLVPMNDVGLAISSASLLQLPTYVWSGLTSTLDLATGFVGAGAALLLGIVAWLIWRRQELGTHAMAYAGAIGAVAFFGMTGITRGGLGLTNSPDSLTDTLPRYSYVAFALLLPAIAWALSRLARLDRLAQLAVLLIIAFTALYGVGELSTQASRASAIKLETRNQILAASELLASGAATINNQPAPTLAPYLTVSELAALQRDGDLPSASQLSSIDRLSAVAALQTSLSALPRFTVGTVRLLAVTGALASAGPSGCVNLQPVGGGAFAFRLSFDGSASLEFRALQPTTLQFFLQEKESPVTASVVSLKLSVDAPSFLNVIPADATPYLTSPDVGLEVCGVDFGPVVPPA